MWSFAFAMAQPSLKRKKSQDNLLGGLYPFLMDDIKVKEYFHLKYKYYVDHPDDLPNDEYVLHHIPDPEEMLYFLYDVEYHYRRARGSQIIFRNQLIKNKLYKLFNILVGTTIPAQYPSNHEPDDKWEMLAYQLLSAWHVYAECICLPPGADKILKLVNREKKYTNLS